VSLSAHGLPEPLRILLLVRALGFGGAERQARQLAQGLAARGHRVRLVAFYPGPFDPELAARNPDLVVIGKRGRYDLARFLGRLLRSMAVFAPDVVYSFLPVPNLLAAVFCTLVRRRAALVWGMRGTPLALNRYDPLARAAVRLERLASRLPDLVIANSASGAAALRGDGFAARPVAMIANGIDTGHFRPASRSQRLAARAALHCPGSAMVVAMVARFDPMKDHPTFFQAIAIAARTAPDLVALIAGDGPPAAVAELHQMAARLGIAGRLIWAEARREVTEIYAAADLLCLPSAFGEGFPNVVGEAMACGRCCVVTAVGDSAAVVGDTGWVVPPRAPQMLAAAILDCLQAIRKIGAVNLNARKRIVDNYGVEAMISATECRLMRSVAQRRGRTRRGRGAGR
jgi:glycosyltransferase involved in cell wall biosynthesis